MAAETSGAPVVVRVVAVHALAAPGAATNIFVALTPSAKACVWRIGVSLATASVFNVVSTDGTTAYTQKLNNGTALTAGTYYTFTMPVMAATAAATPLTMTYSLQVATDGIIQDLIVDEVVGPLI